MRYNLLVIACLLSLISYIAAQSLTLDSGSSVTDISCRHILASKLFSGTKYVTQFSTVGGSETTYDAIELWQCNKQTETFEEKSTYTCASSLPNSDQCQMIFKSTGTNRQTTPYDVSFKFGTDGYEKLIMVVRPATAASVPPAVGIEFQAQEKATAQEAGIMTLGLTNKNTYVPDNSIGSATYSLGSTCDNTCASASSWKMFAAQALISQQATGVTFDYYESGVTNSSSGTFSLVGNAQGVTTNVTLKTSIDLHDMFSIRCTYNVGTQAQFGRDQQAATAATCKVYIMYYPAGAGISSCMDATCINAAGLPDLRSNTTVNYIALILTGIIIGMIIGIALSLIYYAIRNWISENSWRFSKKYLKSKDLFNPLWWFKSREDIEPEEDDEEALLGIKNANEDADVVGDEDVKEEVVVTTPADQAPPSNTNEPETHEEDPNDVPLVAV